VLRATQGSGFYPGSGGGEDDDELVYPNIVNIPLTPMGPELGNTRARGKISPHHVRYEYGCVSTLSQQHAAQRTMHGRLSRVPQ
jgi:hypothetical protein